MSDALEISREVDARGKICPAPILMAKKALAGMESGQLLRVLATDPAAVGDFHFFATQTGNRLVEQDETKGEYVIVLARR